MHAIRLDGDKRLLEPASHELTGRLPKRRAVAMGVVARDVQDISIKRKCCSWHVRIIAKI